MKLRAGDVLVQAGTRDYRMPLPLKLFRGPMRVLEAHTAGDVDALLGEIEQELARGRYAAGFFAYEAGYAFEERLRPLLRATREPLAWFGIYERFEYMEARDGGEGAEIAGGELGICAEEYATKIEAIREWIAEGDVYQINFTDHCEFTFAGDVYALLARLCAQHPVSYATLIDTGEMKIVSISPELFFAVNGPRLGSSKIVVKPMKGTAPRGRTNAEDERLREELRASEKNRAENLMIVDLMRNDLGRICRTGSVRPVSLFDVERYDSVFQMTSTIRGELQETASFGQIIRALFPSGSVTGAPKLRAMELIAQLERAPRGVYTGAMGYAGPGEMKFSVAIRTMVLRGEHGTLGVGGGITWDSRAEQEYEECAWKAAFLTRAEPEFALLETLLWEREYAFFDEHCARLLDSAHYFGFHCDIDAVIKALRATEAAFVPDGAYRVRMQLERDGHFALSHSLHAHAPAGSVAISTASVQSSDRFLFHKTTHRRFYEEQLQTARARGLDDLLFTNERGEVTEGCIHNLFVSIGNELLTPPLECGVLNGIFRQHVLRANPLARERVLTVETLRQADAIYLCNSVRGMYEVHLAAEEEPAAASPS